MTIGPMPQCLTCVRYRSPFSPDNSAGLAGPFCGAFPAGVPAVVFSNAIDHRDPIVGDHGLQWESNGNPFPAWALARP